MGVAIIAALCQAMYLVLARKASDNVKLSQWDLLYFTAVFNCAIFTPLFSSGGSAAEVLERDGQQGLRARHAAGLRGARGVAELRNFLEHDKKFANNGRSRRELQGRDVHGAGADPGREADASGSAWSPSECERRSYVHCGEDEEIAQ